MRPTKWAAQTLSPDGRDEKSPKKSEALKTKTPDAVSGLEIVLWTPYYECNASLTLLVKRFLSAGSCLGLNEEIRPLKTGTISSIDHAYAPWSLNMRYPLRDAGSRCACQWPSRKGK